MQTAAPLSYGRKNLPCKGVLQKEKKLHRLTLTTVEEGYNEYNFYVIALCIKTFGGTIDP